MTTPTALPPETLPRPLWVFGYGSLMWRPGFAFIERSPARLIGCHRSLCVYSHVHRGTREQPGLVLGLDRGGSCRGIAFRVAEAQAGRVMDYLRERELVTHVYRETVVTVVLERPDAPRVKAVTYVVRRDHAQYAGVLGLTDQLRHVRQGHGLSGANVDYVRNTVAAIEELGLSDGKLHDLTAMLAPTGQLTQG